MPYPCTVTPFVDAGHNFRLSSRKGLAVRVDRMTEISEYPVACTGDKSMGKLSSLADTGQEDAKENQQAARGYRAKRL